MRLGFFFRYFVFLLALSSSYVFAISSEFVADSSIDYEKIEEVYELPIAKEVYELPVEKSSQDFLKYLHGIANYNITDCWSSWRRGEKFLSDIKAEEILILRRVFKKALQKLRPLNGTELEFKAFVLHAVLFYAVKLYQEAHIYKGGFEHSLYPVFSAAPYGLSSHSLYDFFRLFIPSSYLPSRFATDGKIFKLIEWPTAELHICCLKITSNTPFLSKLLLSFEKYLELVLHYYDDPYVTSHENGIPKLFDTIKNSHYKLKKYKIFWQTAALEENSGKDYCIKHLFEVFLEFFDKYDGHVDSISAG